MKKCDAMYIYRERYDMKLVLGTVHGPVMSLFDNVPLMWTIMCPENGSYDRHYTALSREARHTCACMATALLELFEIDTNNKRTRGHSCKLKKVRCTRDIVRHFFE